MQDRYAGDIGDFGKFVLLRAIANQNLPLGVNWYLARPGSHEIHKDDGNFRVSRVLLL